MSISDESVSEQERQFYAASLASAKTGPASTGYGNPINQTVRFDAFAQATDNNFGEEMFSLLDIGCGTGDLPVYLAEDAGIELSDYVGFDRDRGMVDAACDRLPDVPFMQGDAVSAPAVLRANGKTAAFDVVACIATLAMKPEDWGQEEVLAYVEEQIEYMVAMADRMVFVTLFSPWKNKILPDEMLVDPAYMLNWALRKYGRAEVNHSYAPHDYALTIHLNEGEWWRAHGLA